MNYVWKKIKKWSFVWMWLFCGVFFLMFIDKKDVYKDLRVPVMEKLSAGYSMLTAGMTEWISEDVMTNPLADAGGEGSGLSGNEIMADSSEEMEGAESTDKAGLEDGLEQKDEGDLAKEGQIAEDGQSSAGGGGASRLDSVEYMTVEDDYFADALFIGDSRTVGLYEYGGLEEISTFYASTGLSIYKIFDTQIVNVPGQRAKITVREAIQGAEFKKIYIMLGINELGTGTVEDFVNKYEEVIEELQSVMPDAIIYIQAIIKVTTARSEKGDYITNDGIAERNEGLKTLADNVKTFYLDVNPYICDESGGMMEEYTADGVHLKAAYILIWKDFLKKHAVVQKSNE